MNQRLGVYRRIASARSSRRSILLGRVRDRYGPLPHSLLVSPVRNGCACRLTPAHRGLSSATASFVTLRFRQDAPHRSGPAHGPPSSAATTCGCCRRPCPARPSCRSAPAARRGRPRATPRGRSVRRWTARPGREPSRPVSRGKTCSGRLLALAEHGLCSIGLAGCWKSWPPPSDGNPLARPAGADLSLNTEAARSEVRSDRR